ncbi:hypothetical protein QOT17_015957 [Balamuthia mandrillaris]
MSKIRQLLARANTAPQQPTQPRTAPISERVDERIEETEVEVMEEMMFIPLRGQPGVLKFHQGLPLRDHSCQATLLFVGEPKSGKKTLARTILNKRWPIRLNIRTAHSLPLPEDEQRPRVDYVVFFVDMTLLQSFKELKTNLFKLDKDFLTSMRACIIATKVDCQLRFAFTTAELEEWADVYGLQVFYCDLVNEGLRDSTAARIVKTIEIATGNTVACIRPSLLSSLEADSLFAS